MSPDALAAPVDVWGDLPALSHRDLALERRAAGWQGAGPAGRLLRRLGESGVGLAFDRPEVDRHAAGLGRPGLVAQLRSPALRTRLGFGVENAIAHAVVDRLLGFDRPFAETRLQLTPVEWGVWTFLILEALDAAGGLGLSLDRVGPDPVDAEGLGPRVTIRWAVRAGKAAGAARLWLPESVAARWVEIGEPEGPSTRVEPPPKAGLLAAEWRLEAGRVRLGRGLRTLRPGGVLPLIDPPLAGTPAEPVGPLALVARTDDGRAFRIDVEPAPGSNGGRVRALGPARPTTRNLGDEPAMNADATTPPDADPMDVPVTLVVELGRLNLPLARLADLKAGDVLPLNRHGREPVELTSNGRVVARGELIRIDEELGLRVTSVFL